MCSLSEEEKKQIVDEKNIEQRAKLVADHPFINEKFNRLQVQFSGFLNIFNSYSMIRRNIVIDS